MTGEGRGLVEVRKSKFNGRVEVWEEQGQVVVRVGGLAQSGGLAEVVLSDGLEWVRKEFEKRKIEVKNFLILGFGGGTAARLARGMWPGVGVVGVEIDEVMVELGRRYIWEREKFEVIVGDGVEWVRENTRKRRFDLVLVDMYRGEEVAKGAEGREFFERVRELMVPGGMVLVNRLFVEEREKEGARRTVKVLEKVFDEVEIFRSEGNLWVVGLVSDARVEPS